MPVLTNLRLRVAFEALILQNLTVGYSWARQFRQPFIESHASTSCKVLITHKQQIQWILEKTKRNIEHKRNIKKSLTLQRLCLKILSHCLYWRLIVSTVELIINKMWNTNVSAQLAHPVIACFNYVCLERICHTKNHHHFTYQRYMLSFLSFVMYDKCPGSCFLCCFLLLLLSFARQTDTPKSFDYGAK